jgi:hypothetical protein
MLVSVVKMATNKHNNSGTVGSGDLYSVLPEFTNGGHVRMRSAVQEL